MFAYGLLEAADVVQRVTGHRFPSRPAVLEGFARYRVCDRDYPAVVPDPEARTPGTLYTDVDRNSLARLDAFEGDEYERRRERVRSGADEQWAFVYRLRAGHGARLSREPWDREGFLRSRPRPARSEP